MEIMYLIFTSPYTHTHIAQGDLMNSPLAIISSIAASCHKRIAIFQRIFPFGLFLYDIILHLQLATVLYRKDVFQISSKHVTSNKSTLFDVLYLLPLSAINGDLSVQRHQEFFNSFNTTHTSVGRNISTPKMLKTQPSNVQKGIYFFNFLCDYLLSVKFSSIQF